MKYAVSSISVIPMRREPSERSEMVSQLLLGECLTILEEKDSWLYVENAFDGYRGWIDSKTITPVSETYYNEYIEHSGYEVSSEICHAIDVNRGDHILIPIGASLNYYRDETKEFEIADKKYRITSSIDVVNHKSSNGIIDMAAALLNAPYLWGGRTAFGIDCSGFTQLLYKIIGIKLPRDASQQVNEGQTINFVSEVKAGDLAFFDNDEGAIVHVGILDGNGNIIHSSGKVRKDTFDQQGIFNNRLGKYTHKLRVIKRVVE
jgi:gamma-D-glutamyl-L-lysine dipeptidyl-peptidase